MTALLKYGDLVESELECDSPKRKGERTRNRLRLSTLRILEEGIVNPKITDICERASVSPGSFYTYFPSIDELVTELLHEWVGVLYSHSPKRGGYGSPFEVMLIANRRLIDLYAANPGLMQCLWRHREKNPEFARVWERNNLTWYGGVRAAILDTCDSAKINRVSYDLCFYVISGLMDEFLRTVYIVRDRELLKVIQSSKMSSDDLAQFLALIWYRVLFGGDPKEAKNAQSLFPNIMPNDRE